MADATLTQFLPIELTETIHAALKESKRVPDGLLHCSSDLCGSLRHTMLRAAGAPMKDNDIMSDIILETGTLWHKRIAKLLTNTGAPFMSEVNVTPWLPKGWAGTADWLFWHPEYEGFVLGDLKTTAGEGLAFIERDGIKTEHHHQLSAYWYACVAAGLPMVNKMVLCYFPKNRAKNYDTKPLELEVAPLDVAYMRELMESRWWAVSHYLDSVESTGGFDTNYLTPAQERELKLVWSRDHYDLKLVPNWTAQFCPFDNELCDCSEQGETKVGEYCPCNDDGPSSYYVPRKSYEGIVPPALTKLQERKLHGTS